MNFLVAIGAFPQIEVGISEDRAIAHSGELTRYDTWGRKGSIVGTDSL